MAIDISNDLVIRAKGKILNTPTKNGIYDCDDCPFEYIPGKDYSLIDDISTGKMVTYLIDIELESKSDQLYCIDKISIGSNDYSDDLTKTKTYYINTDPDALIIQDNNENIYTGTDTTLFPVTLKNSISSNFKFTTSLLFKLPKKCFWKSKLSPSILILAEKSGCFKKFIFNLPEVKIAPKSDYISELSKTLTDDKILIKNINNMDKIIFPFKILSYTQDIEDVINLSDTPKFSKITYNISIEVSSNCKLCKLYKKNFIFKPTKGFNIKNYSYHNNKLSLSLEGSFEKISANSNLECYIVLPFMKNIEIKINWDNNPVYIDFENNSHILYNVIAKGQIISNIELV